MVFKKPLVTLFFVANPSCSTCVAFLNGEFFSKLPLLPFDVKIFIMVCYLLGEGFIELTERLMLRSSNHGWSLVNLQFRDGRNAIELNGFLENTSKGRIIQWYCMVTKQMCCLQELHFVVLLKKLHMLASSIA